MTSSIITVAGVKYAAGLYWQPSAEAKKIAKAAKEAAKQPGFQADFYAVRAPTKSQPIGQFGLGIQSAGHKEGMPSIAACLAGQRMGSWAGAFRVPEGIYFIVVREDLIDPDGDTLFAEENEAQVRLEQEIARGGIFDIICPSEWGVHNSQSTSIGGLLAGKRDITLSRVSGNVKGFMQIGLLGILLVGGYLGYNYYQNEQAKAAAAQQAQELAMEKARKNMATPKEYPKTWQDKPHPLDLIYVCQRGTEAALPRYLGWNLDSLSCGELGMQLIWKRSGNGNAVVPADGKAVVDINYTTATLNVPLEKVAPRGDETLAYYGLIDELLIGKNFPVKLSSMPDDVLPASPNKNAPAPPPPKWRKRKIVYTVPGAPWLHPELFDSIPGLIITTIKSQGSLNSFTVEGIIYENKQP